MQALLITIAAALVMLFVVNITVTTTEERLKRAHCEHIQNRAEYDKCFKEFGEGEP